MIYSRLKDLSVTLCVYCFLIAGNAESDMLMPNHNMVSQPGLKFSFRRLSLCSKQIWRSEFARRLGLCCLFWFLLEPVWRLLVVAQLRRCYPVGAIPSGAQFVCLCGLLRSRSVGQSLVGASSAGDGSICHQMDGMVRDLCHVVEISGGGFYCDIIWFVS